MGAKVSLRKHVLTAFKTTKAVIKLLCISCEEKFVGKNEEGWGGRRKDYNI